MQPLQYAGQSPARPSTTPMHSAQYAGQAPMTIMGPPPSWAGAGHQFQSFGNHHSFVPPASTMTNLSGQSTPYAPQLASSRLLAAPGQNAFRRSFQGAPYNAKRISEAHPPDCQNTECLVDQECNAEECGDEARAPREDSKICGVDKRPLLPCALAVSTVAGLFFMYQIEFGLVAKAFYRPALVQAVALVLHAVTLVCMALTAVKDPGQMKKVKDKVSAALMPVESDLPDENQVSSDSDVLPTRAHKSWMYDRPIRRYDHYCRWVVNVIGLSNHREFILMVTGLALICISGFIVDGFLGYYLVRHGGDRSLLVGVVLHAAYLLILGYCVMPIFRLHVGFVCRNELAQEWVRNTFYVLPHKTSGDLISVNELSDDEYNDRLETAVYDKSLNQFDQGCFHNCVVFWCTSRWHAKEDGAF